MAVGHCFLGTFFQLRGSSGRYVFIKASASARIASSLTGSAMGRLQLLKKNTADTEVSVIVKYLDLRIWASKHIHGTSAIERKRKGCFGKECGRASFRAASQESRDRMRPQTTSAFVQADVRPTCRSLADAGSASFALGTVTKRGTITLRSLYPTLPILAFSARGRMPI